MNVENSRRKQVRRALRAAAAVGLVAVLLTACSPTSGSSAAGGAAKQKSAGTGGPNAGGPGGRPGRGPIPVQADPATSGALIAEQVAAGSVIPVTQSQVAAKVAGVVARVLHNAGDWVQTGEVIVQLDDSQTRLSLANAQVQLKNAQINLAVGQQNASQDNPKLTLQLQSAQAALASAQKNYSATEELFKSGGASSSQVDTAQATLQTAQANVQAAQSALTQNQQANVQSLAQLQLAVDTAKNQLSQAQMNLEDAQISAPFAGQIASVNVTAGEYVGLNTSVFLLVSREKEVAFNISPLDAPSLTPGHQVKFVVAGETYLAQITQTPSSPINGVVPMVASLRSGQNSLPYGAVGNVSYPVEIANGTQVPIPALQTDGNVTYVFTIVAGKAHRQPVTILAETSDTAAVTGLAASSIVISNPPPGLLESAPVAAVQSAASGSTGRPAGGAKP
ncbi:MAG TPA: HlyD family efflux transporter periplasmic adaptor subunit [Spirochaetia bacterium]|nr:HlyD family efflux transporter periplasmic adaptor subunit [Spirochaetia bacterium]